MRVHYIAPVLDNSGYAEAARNYVGALVTAGLDVSVDPISFEHSKFPQGEVLDFIRPCIKRKDPSFKVQILHMTPENYPRFRRKDRHNIALLAWETSRLPQSWLPLINSMQEAWVPSKFNEEVLKSSGVTVPISVIPHTLHESKSLSAASTKAVQGPKEGAYLFYSIFQWLERKNPLGLLLAYLTEFTDSDPVDLIVKTYIHVQTKDGQSEGQRAEIRKHITSLRQGLHLSNPPPIHLILDPLPREELLALHQQGDCFVLPSRGEGFSLAHFEAMALGRLAIGPRWGGNLEFMNDQNSLLIDCTEIPVFGMPWPIYNASQWWASPSIADLRKKLRWAFENREAGTTLALAGKQDILGEYSWEKIGAKMKARLLQLQ